MVHGENSKTAAFVSCKILTEAGALFLNSMALVRGANGLYLSFPSRKRDGQPVKGFEDYYYMERGLKELVQATAIEEFKARCAEMGIDAEKASAPLPPGMHGDDEEDREPREMRESREPREPREPQPREPREYREPPSRQPFRNESRPAFGNGASGGYRNGGGDYANRGGGGGGYRGNGGGDFANRGGGGGGYRSNGGGDFANRGGGGGGYRSNNDYGSNRGGNGGQGGGFRGDDFGNRGGGRGGYDNANRNNYGFPTGSNLANRPLSSRFNPYTGNNDLQVDKAAPIEGPRKIVQDEEE
jgi:DNA-binding cell septation regulator SpoVG